jgi:hypothetical protein
MFKIDKKCKVEEQYLREIKWLRNILTGIEARLNMFEPC